MSGYRDEERVNPESGTETYAAVRLEIENWRWAGVPFYLRAGKRLKKRATEISIQFKQPPLLIFNRMAVQRAVQGDPAQPAHHPHSARRGHFAALWRQGAHHAEHGRLPGESWTSTTRRPSASRAPTATSGCCSTRCSATRRCLRIAMAWRSTWALYTPILEAWAAKNPEVFPNYFAGTWGPDCADHLLEREGHAWRNNLG